MSPEERKLLENTVALVKENNHILRKMRRTLRWESSLRWAYWIIIIAVSFGAYVYVKPYVGDLSKMYSVISKDLGQIDVLKQKIMPR